MHKQYVHYFNWGINTIRCIQCTELYILYSHAAAEEFLGTYHASVCYSFLSLLEVEVLACWHDITIFGIIANSPNYSLYNVWCDFCGNFFRAHKLFAKKQWKGLGVRRIFWIVQWSGVGGVGGVGGVEWLEWFFLEKAICMYIIRSGSMSWLTWCTLFLIWTHISRVIDENVRKIAKNRDLKTGIYGSKNISSCRA